MKKQWSVSEKLAGSLCFGSSWPSNADDVEGEAAARARGEALAGGAPRYVQEVGEDEGRAPVRRSERGAAVRTRIEPCGRPQRAYRLSR